MSSKLGIEMKLYRNTGSTESPTWAELTNVKDVNVDFSKGEADVTTRASAGWKSYRGTLKEFSADFQMVYDPADTSFAAIEAAFMDNTALDLAFADGPIATSGTRYIRTACEVFGFKRGESNEDAVMYDVTVKRTHSLTPPTFVTVGG
jgi:hypothetical protein